MELNYPIDQRVFWFCIALIIAAVIFCMNSPKKVAARNRARHFPGFNSLTPLERQLLIHFFQLPLTDLWIGSERQLLIRDVCYHSDTRGLRHLIMQLQELDRAALIHCLGFDGCDLIERWKPAQNKLRSVEANDSAVHTEWHPAAH